MERREVDWPSVAEIEQSVLDLFDKAVLAVRIRGSSASCFLLTEVSSPLRPLRSMKKWCGLHVTESLTLSALMALAQMLSAPNMSHSDGFSMVAQLMKVQELLTRPGP